MANESDQISKRVLEFLLDSSGVVQLEVELPLSFPQRIDLWYSAGAGVAALPPGDVFALVKRMVPRDCSMEPNSQTPSYDDLFRGFLRKQVCWYEHLCQQARRKGQPQPALPPQWILSPGRPVAGFAALGFRPLPDWPSGFYQSAPGLGQFCVVGSELPVNRETLLLRLLFNRPLRSRALEELRALPEGDEAKQQLLAILAGVVHIIERDPRIPPIEKEGTMTAAVREWELYKQGLIKAGREEGLMQGILAVLSARGLAISEAAREQIQRCRDDDRLQTWISRAALVSSVDELLTSP